MSPLPAPEDRSLRALGARRRDPPAPSPAELIARLRAVTQESSGLVALLDAEAVGGERHLLSAWAHLGRSRSRGSARLRDRSAEFVLYVAGDDQLPRALSKVGVLATTEQFVVVSERPQEPEGLLERFGLVADASVYPRPVTAALLERLGIGASDRAAVPSGAWEGLVLERVAMVDLASTPGRTPAPKP
jgi:tRNA threonylcarbamoyladenosine modification (KEOPS) complex Cgi121 subunit